VAYRRELTTIVIIVIGAAIGGVLVAALLGELLG
jgi:hypothetical protein